MNADPVRQLTALLREAKAVPKLRVDSIAPSSIYDPLYRTIVLALTMRLAGRSVVDGGSSLPDAKLKLYQFVAVHPDLLPSLRGWVAAHAQGERPALEGWARFPRGYAADTLHEKVLTYLLATGEVRRDGKNIHTRTDGKGILASLGVTALHKQAFVVERETLEELTGMKVTLKMLVA